MCARKRSTVEEGGQLRFFSHHAHASMRCAQKDAIVTLGEMVNNTLSHYLEVCQGRSHEDVRWMPRRCRLGAFHVQFIIFQTFRASSAWSVGDFVRRTSAAARRQRRAQPGDACCPCSCSSVRWAQLEAPRSPHIGAGCGYAGRCLRPRSPCTSVY